MIRTLLILTLISTPLFATRKPGSVTSSSGSSSGSGSIKRTFSELDFDFNYFDDDSSSEISSDDEASAAYRPQPSKTLKAQPLSQPPLLPTPSTIQVKVDDDGDELTQELNLPPVNFDDLPLSVVGTSKDHGNIELKERKGRVYWVNIVTDEIVSIIDAEGAPIPMSGKKMYWANVGIDSDTEEDE